MNISEILVLSFLAGGFVLAFWWMIVKVSHFGEDIKISKKAH